MQKHADRTDKRPPIIGGQGTGMAQDLYWPKMDPSLYHGHDRLDPYGQVADKILCFCFYTSFDRV